MRASMARPLGRMARKRPQRSWPGRIAGAAFAAGGALAAACVLSVAAYGIIPPWSHV